MNMINENKLGIILQARMSSERLPGKILKKIGYHSILEEIVFRVSLLKIDVKFIIATSILQENNVIEDFCKDKGILFFRGSENNVLKRYYLCAKKYNLQHIVRLTADNPFLDIEELYNLIELHFDSGADYSHSFDSLPIGVGAEVMTLNTLEKSFKNATKSKHFEHVNEYILDNKDLFNISYLNVSIDKRKQDVSLTVDTSDDYNKACYIIDKSSNKLDLKEVLFWEKRYRLEKL